MTAFQPISEAARSWSDDKYIYKLTNSHVTAITAMSKGLKSVAIVIVSFSGTINDNDAV